MKECGINHVEGRGKKVMQYKKMDNITTSVFAQLDNIPYMLITWANRDVAIFMNYSDF